MSGSGAHGRTSAQINYGGSQRGGYVCDCGYTETRTVKWNRHVRRCPAAPSGHVEALTGAASSHTPRDRNRLADGMTVEVRTREGQQPGELCGKAAVEGFDVVLCKISAVTALLYMSVKITPHRNSRVQHVLLVMCVLRG